MSSSEQHRKLHLTIVFCLDKLSIYIHGLFDASFMRGMLFESYARCLFQLPRPDGFSSNFVLFF